MNYSRRRLTLVLCIIISVVTLSFFAFKFISLAYVQHNRNAMQVFVSQHYAFSIGIFLSAYIMCSALALPVTTLLTLVGGFLFGGIIGSILTIIAATIGATITFLIVRYTFKDYIRNRYKNQADWLNHKLHNGGITYLIAIRCMMLLPFFLINILSGLLPISLLEFTWTTCVGIIPGSCIYAFAGQELGTIKSPQDILSPHKITILICLGFIVLLLPKMIERIHNGKNKKIPGD